MICAPKRVDLENIMMSEISQLVKDKGARFPLPEVSQAGKSIEAESGKEVRRGGGWYRWAGAELSWG